MPKTSDLTALLAADVAQNDVLEIVDVSDTATMSSPSGANKQITVANLSTAMFTNPTFSGNTVITANASTDAVRITQVGSGNALVVEDIANPDSTPFVVTSTGNVGIGTLTPTTKLDVSGDITASSFIGSVTSTGSTIARSLANRFADVVNVKDFGAVGDGVADDTTAFANMVSYCESSGKNGFMPKGVYLINQSIRTISGNFGFKIYGEGVNSTILKNINTSGSFIYWTNANNVRFEDLTIDGSFTGSPNTPSSGGTLVFVNSNNVIIRNVDIINIYRVGVLNFNDHQTTLTNVYSGNVLDNVRFFGPSNYINNVGPSAAILGDCDNSAIRNCYAENIGQYGFEFKNDCNNCVIDKCNAINTYKPFYFGGDGVNTGLLYVKNSIISNCIAIDASEPFVIGLASNILISNCESKTTDSGPVFNRATISIGQSVNCTVSNLLIVNRKTYACDIRDSGSGNNVSFVLADGAYKGEAIAIATDSSGNKVSIIWKNHDSSVLNTLRYQSNNRVEDLRGNYFYNYSLETNPKIVNALTNSQPPLSSTVKGMIQFGSTFDTYTNSNQDSLFENFGNYDTAVLSQVRHRFDNGSKIERIWATGGSSYVDFIKNQAGFIPGTDNTLAIGTGSSRWSVIYAGSGVINTSDSREKQQVKSLSDSEKSVAIKLKSLIKSFKFNDAVSVKGDSARIHIGVIAQDVIDAFNSEGLNPFDYAIVCYDEWDETIEESDEDRNIAKKITDAGNRFGIRYDQLLAFIISSL
jgi:hypothetical protein